ncbi:MAG: YIP1 family protein [Candidatus Heimdallarchaeota archaeon]|nr:YIP1 family protein [Candidatus Heimdallarchaeota archaeon]
MTKEVPDTTEDEDDLFHYTPFQRLLGHHLLEKQSFTNMPKAYLIATPIIVLALVLAFTLANFAILSSKMQLIPIDELSFSSFKESIYFGILLSSIPQILLWSLIVHGLLIFLGGKGKILKSLAIYAIAQIPLVLGLVVLTVIASTQTKTVIYPHGFPLFGTYLLEYRTINVNYDLFQIFNVFANSYTIASNVIVPITTLYAMIIAGVGLSSEHKVPLMIGLFITGLAYIASMVFYFIV